MKTIIRSAVGSTASLGLLSFLKESGFRVIGTDIIDGISLSDYLDGYYKVSKSTQGQKVIEEYINITKREDARWIISGPETEIILLARHSSNLKPLNVYPFHDSENTLEIITNKHNLYEFMVKHGIEVPETYILAEYKNQLGGTLVLKPLCGRGSTGVYIITVDKLKYVEMLIEKNDYIVQPYIDGREFTVDTLHDFEGNLLNVVPRRRISVESGISISAETCRDEKFFEIIDTMSGLISFNGANCFQFIVKDNKYYLTDINPRFGGGSILSIRASASFRNNIINLLSGDNSKLLKNSFDFDIMKMYRYYHEIYSY